MPPKKQQPRPPKQKPLHQLVQDVGLYPAEAYDFIQRGLGYTVERIHGDAQDPTASKHVNGQQLCLGLRDYALLQWGLLARTVLRRWNITSTLDFGRIVFAMVEAGYMQTTAKDSIEDFKAVYDFRTLECGYRIGTGAGAS